MLGAIAFISDPAQIGTPYLGEHFVCQSSGTTGHPGLFVHDGGACAVYQAFTLRIDQGWLSGRQWLQMLRLLAGRLHLRPVVVELGGESLDEAGRAHIAAGLGAAVHDSYSASECVSMAFDCAHGWLHVHSDWVILEPVEADGSPTPPGQVSHTVLLTNLANRVQPFIRYDLGDTVVERPDPCPCGSPLQAIRVQGRRDDVLRLQAATGRKVSIPPLAIGSVIDEVPGVERSQLVQAGPTSLRLRLDLLPGVRAEQVWSDTCARLAGYLTAQGLEDVEVIRGSEAPRLRNAVPRAGSSGRSLRATTQSTPVERPGRGECPDRSADLGRSTGQQGGEEAPGHGKDEQHERADQ